MESINLLLVSLSPSLTLNVFPLILGNIKTNGLVTLSKYSSRNANNIPLVRLNNYYFMNTLFPSTITEWNKLEYP